MSELKNRFYKCKHAYLQAVGVIFILLLAAALLWYGN